MKKNWYGMFNLKKTTAMVLFSIAILGIQDSYAEQKKIKSLENISNLKIEHIEGHKRTKTTCEEHERYKHIKGHEQTGTTCEEYEHIKGHQETKLNCSKSYLEGVEYVF